MGEWKEIRLIDVLETLIDYRGKTPRKTTLGIPLITAKIIKNGRIETPSEFISVDDYDSWMVRGFPKVGDVVLTTEAPLGEVAQLNDDNIALAQRVVTLRGKSGILDNTYLKYFFLSRVGQQRLKARETGTTVTGIKQSELKEVLVDVPPYEVQVKIASILSSLDDKIEVNRRINENLEQQAQALFKSWFVDFEPFKECEFVESELGMIPKGWRVIELQDVVKIKRGGSPRPIQAFLSESGYKWLKISDATACKSPFLYDIKEHIKESGLSKTILLKPGSLVLSNSATPGIPKILGVESCVHDGWLYFPQSELSKYYLYLLFIQNRNFLLSQGNGSVFTNLKTDILKTLKIVLPSKHLLWTFDKIIESLFIQIENKTKESRRLASLRDTLLPRLMSGEIRVDEINVL